MIKECDCYCRSERFGYNPIIMKSYVMPYNYCNGTRERDECFCGGDRTKCDFYPEVRDNAIREIKKIVTNGDNIRSMNDKELAKFLMSKWFTDGVCKNCDGQYDKCGDFEFCTEEIFKWLIKNID